MPYDANDPLSATFRADVSRVIAAYLEQRRAEVREIGGEITPLVDAAELLVSGGKRFRPGFCWWGFAAASGQPVDSLPVLAAAASFDLLHASALAHDDVMDASDTRRGKPAAHVAFAANHRRQGWRGDSDSYGRAGAILLGVLLLMWSVAMVETSSLDRLAAARPLLDAVRTEVTCGQFLDIRAQSERADPERAVDLSRRVTEYKSARYTVTRPLQAGAVLGGASAEVVAALGAYGSPLGRAFQLRDDLLGVYGDEALTGKPAGDDLREGKQTLLVGLARQRSADAARSRLEALVGDPALDAAGVDEARGIIDASGAVALVEAEIQQGYETAVGALDSVQLHDDGETALLALANLAVRRVY